MDLTQYRGNVLINAFIKISHRPQACSRSLSSMTKTLSVDPSSPKQTVKQLSFLFSIKTLLPTNRPFDTAYPGVQGVEGKMSGPWVVR